MPDCRQTVAGAFEPRLKLGREHRNVCGWSWDQDAKHGANRLAIDQCGSPTVTALLARVEFIPCLRSDGAWGWVGCAQCSACRALTKARGKPQSPGSAREGMRRARAQAKLFGRRQGVDNLNEPSDENADGAIGSPEPMPGCSRCTTTRPQASSLACGHWFHRTRRLDHPPRRLL